MPRTGPAAWLLYIALRLVFALIEIFPIDRNLRTARWMARIWARILPRHYGRAVDNLQASLGRELSPGELARIARESLESATMFAIEAVCLPRLINAFTWHRYIRLVDSDEPLRQIISGRGAMLVTAHYGSFELVGHLLACLGFDVRAVMRPIDLDYANRFIVRARRRHGLILYNKRGATEHAEEALRSGALVGFIGDQDAGSKGVFVDFFGRPASAYKSIALLAMAAEVPVIVGYARRVTSGKARYEVATQRIIQPEEWKQQADPIRWITQAYTMAIEEFIRAEPGQYWWLHRRWKSQPGVRRRRKKVSPAVDSAETPTNAENSC